MHGESPGEARDNQQQRGNDDTIEAAQRAAEPGSTVIGLSAAGAS